MFFTQIFHGFSEQEIFDDIICGDFIHPPRKARGKDKSKAANKK